MSKTSRSGTIHSVRRYARRRRATRQRAKGARRRFLLEPLERRTLLSGTSATADLNSSGSLLALDSSVSGYVYVDTDSDGVRDSGETGVPGVLITLTGTDNDGSSVNRNAITSSSGYYVFDGLSAGTYQIGEAQPAAMCDGPDSVGIPDAVTGNDLFTQVVISGADNFTENNFGEQGLLADYTSIAWFFSSSPSMEQMLRETIAKGEEKSGNLELAAAIRASASHLNDVGNDPPLTGSDAYTVDENDVLAATAADGVLSQRRRP